MPMKTLLLSLLGLSFAASCQAANLLDVWQAAQAHDATLAAAEADWRAAAEKMPQAQSALKPQISVSANATWNNGAFDFALPGSAAAFSGTTEGLTLQLVQPLWHRDRQIAERQAQAVVSAAGARLALARQHLMLQVATAYFNVLMAGDAMTALQAQQAAVAEQLAAAQHRFAAGKTTITDVNEALARRDLVAAQQVAAANQIAVAQQALASLTGAPVSVLDGLRDSAPAPGLADPEMAHWVEAAQTRSLRVRMLAQALRQAELEQARRKAQDLPTVDLVASDSRTAGQLSMLQLPRLATVGVQMTLPLDVSGRVASQVREAAARQEEARDQLEQARRDARLQAGQAYLAVTAGMAQVKALQQALQSARSDLASTRLAVRVGVRTTADLLTAVQGYYATAQQLDDARYRLLLGDIRLAAAASELTPAALARVSAALTQPVQVPAHPS